MSERPRLLGPSHGVAVKVCGLTRVEDAALAWRLGAAALGFIFHPESPRFIPPQRAQAIRRALPPEAVCVGVFVDRDIADVNRVADLVGLDFVQLHGREGQADLRAANRPVIKVVRAEDEAGVEALEADLLLLDAAHPTLAGGTGLRADWSLAARLARRCPLLLAGGIDPENALEALAQVGPRALDVNSGVEAAPGIKDPHRLRSLFTRLHASLELPHA